MCTVATVMVLDLPSQSVSRRAIGDCEQTRLQAAALPVYHHRSPGSLSTHPPLLILLQNAATVLINVAATKAGFLEMKPWKLSEIKQFLVPQTASHAVIHHWWQVQGLFFAATLGLSNFGLPRVATSTLIVPKSLTTIFCMWAETWLGLVRAVAPYLTVSLMLDFSYDRMCRRLLASLPILHC